ncbi:MAG: sodium:proton antiporter [Micropepsaceae bacterium]
MSFSKSLASVVAGIVAATVVTSLPACASQVGDAGIDGTRLDAVWAVPFLGLLVSIAILPLAAPHFWHHHYGKVTAAWALSFLVPFAMMFGVQLTHSEFLHVTLMEYVPFITVLFALYTISGGVFIDGTLTASPFRNTAILAVGALIASVTGTTGASVLLIRPLLRANANRKYIVHVVVFFIFLVSNIGGSLTPLGDPPLYIGFLKGVDFTWPAIHLWQITALVAAILLSVFFLLDTVLMLRENEQVRAASADRIAIQPKGLINIALLVAVVAVILASAFWKTDLHIPIGGIQVDAPNILRVIVLLGFASMSLLLTPAAYRESNSFTWGPIVEVAKLFAGIFVTIIPVIAMLKAGSAGAFAPVLALVTSQSGAPDNAMYFWLTGGLSSFLDNAPTYLVFFNAAGGDPQTLMGPMAKTLAAISAGAVFMGANTYIGNAPNFMVKAIAEEAGVRMPSFFGYMLWSGALLIPCFVLTSIVFFS